MVSSCSCGSLAIPMPGAGYCFAVPPHAPLVSRLIPRYWQYHRPIDAALCVRCNSVRVVSLCRHTRIQAARPLFAATFAVLQRPPLRLAR